MNRNAQLTTEALDLIESWGRKKFSANLAGSALAAAAYVRRESDPIAFALRATIAAREIIISRCVCYDARRFYIVPYRVRCVYISLMLRRRMRESESICDTNSIHVCEIAALNFR